MLERSRLGHHTEDVAGDDGRTLLGAWIERPAALAIERRHVDAAWEQRTPDRIVAHARKHFERALGAVEDAPEQPWAELDLQWPARVADRLTDAQARSVLVDLDRGSLAIEADDLPGQLRVADVHDVVEPHPVEAARDHDRPCDTPDLARGGHGVGLSSPNLISKPTA
jgi:hypothetical protein